MQRLLQLTVSNRLCKLNAISMQYVAVVLQGFNLMQTFQVSQKMYCGTALKSQLVCRCDLESRSCVTKIGVRLRRTLHRKCKWSLEIPLIHLGTKFNDSRTQSVHISFFLVFFLSSASHDFKLITAIIPPKTKNTKLHQNSSDGNISNQKSQMIWHSVGEIQADPFVFVSRFIIHCFCLTLSAAELLARKKKKTEKGSPV